MALWLCKAFCWASTQEVSEARAPNRDRKTAKENTMDEAFFMNDRLFPETSIETVIEP
jgi:hypothetical protein